jgi:hypothetical protein
MALSITELDGEIVEYLPDRQVMSILPKLPDLVGKSGTGLLDLSETQDGLFGLTRGGLFTNLGK